MPATAFLNRVRWLCGPELRPPASRCCRAATWLLGRPCRSGIALDVAFANRLIDGAGGVIDPLYPPFYTEQPVTSVRFCFVRKTPRSMPRRANRRRPPNIQPAERGSLQHSFLRAGLHARRITVALGRARRLVIR